MPPEPPRPSRPMRPPALAPARAWAREVAPSRVTRARTAGTRCEVACSRGPRQARGTSGLVLLASRAKRGPRLIKIAPWQLQRRRAIASSSRLLLPSSARHAGWYVLHQQAEARLLMRLSLHRPGTRRSVSQTIVQPAPAHADGAARAPSDYGNGPVGWNGIAVGMARRSNVTRSDGAAIAAFTRAAARHPQL